MHYVAGFLFSTGNRGEQSVLLVKKNRPSYLLGKRNGPGGGVERGESAVVAMVREMKEETDIDTSQRDWGHFLTMNTTRGDRIDFFVARYFKQMGKIRQMTDEEVEWIPLNALESNNVYQNVIWEIPMALRHLEPNKDYKSLTILENA